MVAWLATGLFGADEVFGQPVTPFFLKQPKCWCRLQHEGHLCQHSASCWDGPPPLQCERGRECHPVRGVVPDMHKVA